jgi:ELWxxDGT repeat protein
MRNLLFLLLLSILLPITVKAQFRLETLEIDPGQQSYPGDMIAFKGKAYLYAHFQNTQALWSVQKNDTPVTTNLIPDRPYLGHASNNTYWHMAVDGGRLFFSIGDTDQHKKLGIYDGSNPVYIADSAAWTNLAAPEFITPLNGIIYFKGLINSKCELFSYDPVTDKVAKHSNFDTIYTDNIWNLTAFNGKLYFYAAASGTDYELYEYTPGDAAPVLIADINPGAVGSMPNSLCAYKGKLYFSAATATHGRELYCYDGVNPPRMIADLNPGTAVGCHALHRHSIIGYKNNIYFRGDNGTTGHELYKYDIAADTIGLAYEFEPGNSNEGPVEFVIWGSNLVMYTSAPNRNNFRLWRFDGVSNPVQIPTSLVGKAWLDAYFTTVDSQLYFIADGATQVFRLTDSRYTELPTDTTDTPSHIAIIPLKGKVTVYPNPAHDAATLEISLQESQAFTITLTDVHGRVVYTIAKKQYNAGKHNITLPMASLPAGMYYYRVSNSNVQMASGKVMKE